MSDLWMAASEDQEAERALRNLEAARVALAPYWSMLTTAGSQVDYENRKALIADRVLQVVAEIDPADESLVERIEASFDADFQTISSLRQSHNNSGQDKLHNEDGTHKVTAPTANGKDVADFSKAHAEHTQHQEPPKHEGSIQQEGERDRATRPRLGDQTACRTCGSDIEYHGGEHGWIDRGGNKFCDTSGQHPTDENGASGSYPHTRHQPVSDRVASLQVEAVAWGRRHYEDLASSISNFHESGQAAKHFAQHLSGTNPNYRSDQFEQAASTQGGYKVRGGTGTANYSRGHYQHIAAGIKSYQGDREGLAKHLADHFANTSANFNRDRFLKASTGALQVEADQKSARDLAVGDVILSSPGKSVSTLPGAPGGPPVGKVDKTTTPGTVYVWFKGNEDKTAADLILNHGDPVKIGGSKQGSLRTALKYKHLPESGNGQGIHMSCTNPTCEERGNEYSPDRGDYFMANDEDDVKCGSCGGGMSLFKKHTVNEPYEPKTGSLQADDEYKMQSKYGHRFIVMVGSRAIESFNNPADADLLASLVPGARKVLAAYGDDGVGEKHRLRLPYSEVCMHMQVAGKEMLGALTSDGYGVQLYSLDGKPFSFPITKGEAGWGMSGSDLGPVTGSRLDPTNGGIYREAEIPPHSLVTCTYCDQPISEDAEVVETEHGPRHAEHAHMGSRMGLPASLLPRQGASTDPIAYTYEADVHCPACARRRFGAALDDPDTEDGEGNPVGAIFPWSETSDTGEYCGDCGDEIVPPWKEGVRHTAPGGGEHGGYHLEEHDGGWFVVNHIGERKNKEPMSHDKALGYQRALMVNVPGAQESAEKHEESGDKPKESSLHTGRTDGMSPAVCPDCGADILLRWDGHRYDQSNGQLTGHHEHQRTATLVTAAPNPRIAGPGAKVVDPYNSGIQHEVPEGTVAQPGQGYVTFMGTKVWDWKVQNFEGSWNLSGNWKEDESSNIKEGATYEQIGGVPAQGKSRNCYNGNHSDCTSKSCRCSCHRNKEGMIHTAAQVHTFESTGDAYNRSQTDDSIKDGDILHVPSEGVVGYMHSAWPVAVTDKKGMFHGLNNPGAGPRGEGYKVCQSCHGSGQAEPGANAPHRKEGDTTCWGCSGKGGYEGDSRERVQLWHNGWRQARDMANQNGYKLDAGGDHTASLHTAADEPPKKKDDDGPPKKPEDAEQHGSTPPAFDPSADTPDATPPDASAELDPATLNPGDQVTVHYYVNEAVGGGSTPATFQGQQDEWFMFQYERGTFGVKKDGDHFVDGAGQSVAFEPMGMQQQPQQQQAPQPGQPQQQQPLVPGQQTTASYSATWAPTGEVTIVAQGNPFGDANPFNAEENMAGGDGGEATTTKPQPPPPPVAPDIAQAPMALPPMTTNPPAPSDQVRENLNAAALPPTADRCPECYGTGQGFVSSTRRERGECFACGGTGLKKRSGLGFQAVCMDCGHEGLVPRTAALNEITCVCGSSNVTLEDAAFAQAKVAEITEGILNTNPNLDRREAMRLAEATVERFPGVVTFGEEQ